MITRFGYSGSKPVQQGLTGVGLKITEDGDYDIDSKRLVNVDTPVDNGDAVNKIYTDTAIELYDEHRELGGLQGGKSAGIDENDEPYDSEHYHLTSEQHTFVDNLLTEQLVNPLKYKNNNVVAYAYNQVPNWGQVKDHVSTQLNNYEPDIPDIDCYHAKIRDFEWNGQSSIQIGEFTVKPGTYFMGFSVNFKNGITPAALVNVQMTCYGSRQGEIVLFGETQGSFMSGGTTFVYTTAVNKLVDCWIIPQHDMGTITSTFPGLHTDSSMWAIRVKDVVN